VFLEVYLMVVYRNFLTKSYPTMKKHNPHTPIMLREASGIEPKVYARYGASTLPIPWMSWQSSALDLDVDMIMARNVSRYWMRANVWCRVREREGDISERYSTVYPLCGGTSS